MNAEKKLSLLCRERIKEQGKTLARIKKGLDKNPFPIGKTNLENIYYNKGLSIQLQIKLAQYFGLKVKLIIE